eukprot:scaffold85861_cov59-Phaeocystis_antarctica.AAC.2
MRGPAKVLRSRRSALRDRRVLREGNAGPPDPGTGKTLTSTPVLGPGPAAAHRSRVLPSWATRLPLAVRPGVTFFFIVG